MKEGPFKKKRKRPRSTVASATSYCKSSGMRGSPSGDGERFETASILRESTHDDASPSADLWIFKHPVVCLPLTSFTAGERSVPEAGIGVGVRPAATGRLILREKDRLEEIAEKQR